MRIVRHALPVFLILPAASPTAFAQSIVCTSIRQGESAAQAARRVTGDARNAYQASFQIMNASSRFIPKSQYNRIHAGWRACVIHPIALETFLNPERLPASHVLEPLHTATAFQTSGTAARPARLSTADRLQEAVRSMQSAAADALRRIRRVDLTMVWLGVSIVVAWFGWWLADDYLARRGTMEIVVRQFALRFVDEFERPLVRNRTAERAVRSRLRIGVRRGRFDILLAPGTGRRYPNLSDHRKNVEYDVARVTGMLDGDSFVRGPLTTHSDWVVVPFQLKSAVTSRRASGVSAGQRQGQGVACISS